MIKNTLSILDEMGVMHAWVYTSIETRMKCSIGNAVAASRSHPRLQRTSRSHHGASA
jgi:hypothetical protein